MNEDILTLLNKYDVQVPRYTSYPTVPYWEPESIDVEKWKQSVLDTFLNENGTISIYIHLPFCENLCTFCACNKRITKNHKVEEPYLKTVLKEWTMYRALLPYKPVIKELHLGGGTPTFFSPENLAELVNGITKDTVIAPEHEFSVEVHPNHTTEKHIKTLAEVGFNRISIGVQDFDPVVQLIINRVQSFEQTYDVVKWAKKYNFSSINIDLIYGLPKQTVSSIVFTIQRIKELMPDRIAFYSYAHVPWKSKVQRRYTEADLPKADEKWEMYNQGMKMLNKVGYLSIGMDHFALPKDKLFAAVNNGTMHRNFMGYTTTQNKLIIGLGCSSISDSWNAFAQNEKEVEKYQNKINNGEFPLLLGHLLNKEDLIIRQYILNLMCLGKTEIDLSVFDHKMNVEINSKLSQLADDGLIEYHENNICVSEKGKVFVRTICSAIDARLWRKHPNGSVFSKAI